MSNVIKSSTGLVVDVNSFNFKMEYEENKRKQIQDMHDGIEPPVIDANIDSRYKVKESEKDFYHVLMEIKAHNAEIGEYIVQNPVAKLSKYTFKKQWDKEKNDWKQNIREVCKYKTIIHDPTKVESADKKQVRTRKKASE